MNIKGEVSRRVSRSKSSESKESKGFEDRLSALGLGLVLAWIGTALLIGFVASNTLLGVGVIMLVIQAARKRYGLRFEGIWLVIGLVLVGSGLGALTGLQLPLLPVVLIGVGLLLIVGVVRGKRD